MEKNKSTQLEEEIEKDLWINGCPLGYEKKHLSFYYNEKLRGQKICAPSNFEFQFEIPGEKGGHTASIDQTNRTKHLIPNGFQHCFSLNDDKKIDLAVDFKISIDINELASMNDLVVFTSLMEQDGTLVTPEVGKVDFHTLNYVNNQFVFSLNTRSNQLITLKDFFYPDQTPNYVAAKVSCFVRFKPEYIMLNHLQLKNYIFWFAVLDSIKGTPADAYENDVQQFITKLELETATKNDWKSPSVDHDSHIYEHILNLQIDPCDAFELVTSAPAIPGEGSIQS